MAANTSAADSFNLPRHVLKPVGRTLSHKLLEEALAQGYDLLDVSKCLNVPGSGELIRSYKGRMRIAAQFVVYGCDAEGSNSIRQQCDNVLTKLSIDKIDFFYQKSNKKEFRVVEVMAQLKELVEEGLVGHVGISQKNPAVIREAHNVHPLSAVTIAISPWCPPKGNPAVKACRELGISIIATKVKAGGLMDITTRDSKRARDEAAAVLASQRDKLVKRVVNAHSQSRSKHVNKAKNLLIDFAMKFSSGIHSFVCQQDVRFLGKLRSKMGDTTSGFVDSLFDVTGAQRQKLMVLADVVISNHLKRLNTKLEKVEVYPEISTIVKQIMESMLAKLFHRLVLTRSKQMEIRSNMTESEFDGKSDLCAFAWRICNNQKMAFSRRLSRMRTSFMKSMVTELESICVMDKKPASVITAATTDRSIELETSLLEVLDVRNVSSMPLGLVRLLQNQKASLKSEMLEKTRATSSLSMPATCFDVVTKQDEVVMNRVARMIDNRSAKEKELAVSIAGENFYPANSPPEDMSRLGHAILEEGVMLNKSMQQFAAEKGVSLLGVAYAWLQTQGNDIAFLSCLERPMKMKTFRMAAELAGREEIHEVDEYISAYENEVNSSLSWVDIDQGKEYVEVEVQD